MSPQGDLIQLSLSCNGRYVNPKGGSSRPRCQPFLQKLQHWTNRAVNWVNCTSQTPGFKDASLGRVQLPSSGGSGTGYGLLNLDRQNIQSQPLALYGPYPQLPELWLRMPDPALKLGQQVPPDRNLPRGPIQEGS